MKIIDRARQWLRGSPAKGEQIRRFQAARVDRLAADWLTTTNSINEELRQDLDGDGIERELSSLLDELQIGHVADQLGASLSGGERRRCEIARALAARPRLMLLDEPFAGVDPISVGEIQRIVTHLKNRGIGVLITDHNVRETLGICDRAYILNEGSVLAQGAPEALLSNPDVRRVYLGETFRL